jgi:predicted ATPase
MSNAKLLAVSVERFKSFQKKTRIELAPVTVILGRNNSGKSSLIQSLLLLKQTLSDPRADVMLKHEGMVDALNLRELTYGWPSAGERVDGPSITLEWDSEVNIKEALHQPRMPDLGNLAKHSGVSWLEDPPETRLLRTKFTIETQEVDGAAVVSSLHLESVHDSITSLKVLIANGGATCTWNGRQAAKIDVEFDHFIPYLRIDRSNLASRDKQRAWHNAYLVLFAEPLADLKKILIELQYLGSGREPPPSLYRAKVAPNELGVNGEFAAHLLHRRASEIVHFLPLPEITSESPRIPELVLASPLVDAVNTILSGLSVNASVRVEDVKDVGFRLMFGDASILHVGRGLGYLLPLVELGLFADPIKFMGDTENMSRKEYELKCSSFTQIALEEPEAHLHPKVASRLAHWIVSLALSNRRVIVETHSDHLVRRLRGLVARSGRGSDFEQWLLDNVVVLSVEQDAEGRSTVASSRLTADGGVRETWPVDFMDEATDEESAIYYAKLDKSNDVSPASGINWIEGDEPAISVEP